MEGKLSDESAVKISRSQGMFQKTHLSGESGNVEESTDLLSVLVLKRIQHGDVFHVPHLGCKEQTPADQSNGVAERGLAP